jgi:hypothetical protein
MTKEADLPIWINVNSNYPFVAQGNHNVYQWVSLKRNQFLSKLEDHYFQPPFIEKTVKIYSILFAGNICLFPTAV